MTITIDSDLIALLLVGLIAGTAAASLLERSTYASANWVRNVIIGVLGAFIGALIFDVLNLNDDIPEILSGTISVADIVVAFVGAVVLLVVARRVL
jgi:uncharacterized membrane protein YeaQ/YmgE (transglycosylase-associated protein family)